MNSKTFSMKNFMIFLLAPIILWVVADMFMKNFSITYTEVYIWLGLSVAVILATVLLLPLSGLEGISDSNIRKVRFFAGAYATGIVASVILFVWSMLYSDTLLLLCAGVWGVISVARAIHLSLIREFLGSYDEVEESEEPADSDDKPEEIEDSSNESVDEDSSNESVDEDEKSESEVV